MFVRLSRFFNDTGEDTILPVTPEILPQDLDAVAPFVEQAKG
jgi:hypothetical protein